MDLKGKLRTGILATTLAAGLSGCISMNADQTKYLCDGALLPNFLEPGVCDEAREEIREREEEKIRRGLENGIAVETPSGYTVHLSNYSEVRHNGERYLVGEINPPNISIFKAFPINDIEVCNFLGLCSGKTYSFFEKIESVRNERFVLEPVSMMSDNEFVLYRQEDALVVGRAIFSRHNRKIYFDPEEGENEERYSTIPIKELDIFKE